MPRPRKPGQPEAKKRSRFGCWQCKGRKIKCGEEKPQCLNCEKSGEGCDYSIRLNWDGRSKRTDLPSGASWSVEGSSEQSSGQSVFSIQSPAISTASDATSTTSASQVAQSSKVKDIGPKGIADGPAPPLPSWPSYSPNLNHVGNASAQITNNDFDLSRRPRSSEHTGQDPKGHTPVDFTPGVSSAADMGHRSFHLDSKRQRVDNPPNPPTTRPRLFNQASSDFVDSAGRSWKVPSPMMHQLPAPLRVPSPLTSHSSDENFPRLNNPLNPLHRPSSALRRLSVKSLLSCPQTEDDQRSVISETDSITSYGFDQGRPDLDLPGNDDANALIVLSPASTFRNMHQVELSSNERDSREFGFGLKAKDAFEKGGYYSEPVPVKIPTSFEPLPSILTQNPMNLLYFHHFLNHTARVLVPHEGPENPFRSILPQMAVRSTSLLNLLLAYSASHRARLLGNAEPANRIATWVRDVFPNLRKALGESREHFSNANLATSIMLASLEIISPNAFEVPISWQDHLTTAHQMILSRGGYQSLHKSDKPAYFLRRWFAYLDIFGSLSGTKYNGPLTGSHGLDEPIIEEEDAVDCMFGFTGRCCNILVRIADLARKCDRQRIGADGHVNDDWQPEPRIVEAALALEGALEHSRTQLYRSCSHQISPNTLSNAANSSSLAQETKSVNDAFHWAGLIHLHRRVIGSPSTSIVVQGAVREIIATLELIQHSRTAEGTMIFPMFTAGCEAQGPAQRRILLERMAGAEGFGMFQVHRARKLMQEVWKTGRPWETLVDGEFFG